MSENLVEKYATKTYIDKDYKDIVVNEKQFVNLVNENKKQKEVLDKIKEYCIKKKEDSKQEIITITVGDKEYFKYVNEILDKILEELDD